MSGLPTRTKLQVGVETLAAESGGLLTLDTVRASDVPHLMTDALFGDAEALALVGAVMRTLGRVAKAPKHQAALCAACPRPVRENDKFAIVIVRGAIDEPSQGIGMVICNRCGPTPGAIRAAAAVGLRGIFPEARDLGNVDLKQAGGRA